MHVISPVVVCELVGGDFMYVASLVPSPTSSFSSLKQYALSDEKLGVGLGMRLACSCAAFDTDHQ